MRRAVRGGRRLALLSPRLLRPFGDVRVLRWVERPGAKTEMQSVALGEAMDGVWKGWAVDLGGEFKAGEEKGRGGFVDKADAQDALVEMVGKELAGGARSARIRVQGDSIQWTGDSIQWTGDSIQRTVGATDGAVGGSIAMFDRAGQRPGVWRGVLKGKRPGVGGGVLKGKVDVTLKRGERSGPSEGLIYSDGTGKVVMALGSPSDSRPEEVGPSAFDGAVTLLVLTRNLRPGAVGPSAFDGAVTLLVLSRSF
ncbi:hypothetical protein T484DRAFT_1768286 [Baffinella frigidus]|nr:hypothetical protein T484DRAFT_1768286 [Cryptophyta sp. CCMP2293]